MAENNPILTKDIIDAEGISSALDVVINKASELQKVLEGTLIELTKEARELASEMKNTRNSLDKVIPADTTGKVYDLHNAFQGVLKDYQEVEATVQGLKITQKNYNDLIKAQKQYVDENGDSYNNWQAQYNAIKAVMNNLNPAIKEQNDLLKKLGKSAEDLMNKMNNYQKATGKFTLQVGNYERATNGLVLSINQVTRELPSLANSMNQFAMAISNNIPILVDNWARYAKEQKNAQAQYAAFIAQGMTSQQAIAAMGEGAKFLGSSFKALLLPLKSVTGWIGIISTAIVFLTKYISKWKKEQDEANGKTKDAITLEKLLHDELQNEITAISNRVGKLKVLKSILDDVNRSNEDHISALNEIKKITGETTLSLDEYIKKLTERAKAETKVAAIVKNNLEIERLQEERNDVLKEDKNKKTIERYRRSIERQEEILAKYRKPDGSYWGITSTQLQVALDKIKEYEGKIAKVTKKQDDAISELEKANAKLLPEVDPTVLGFGDKDKKGRVKSIKDIKDFTFELWQTRIDGMEEGADKEVEALKLRNAKEIYELKQNEANLNAELIQAQKDGNTKRIAEINKQLGILKQIAVQQTENIYKDLLAIRDKYIAESAKEFSKLIVPVEEEVIDEAMVLTPVMQALQDIVGPLTTNLNALQRAVLDQDYSKAVKTGREYNKLLREQARLIAEKEREKLGVDLATGVISQADYDKAILEVDQKLAKSLKKISGSKGKKSSVWDLMFGEVSYDEFGNVTKRMTSEQNAFINQVVSGFQTAIQYAQEYLNVLSEIAQKEVDAANAKVDAAKEAYDYERQARANGYANSVEVARKEYQEKLKLQKEAIAKQKEIAKIQEQINTAMQVSSLITATAQLWMAHASIPIAGPILAGAATAAMWTAFLASKIKAKQLADVEYGDGMSEYLDYGGSHASGNDIDFGATRDGRRRRVERGEVIGVVNKKNVRKFGARNVTGIIDSLNDGTFGQKYGNAFSDVLSLEHNTTQVDLSKLEKGVDNLVESGSRKVVVADGCIIEYYKNSKRIIRN